MKLNNQERDRIQHALILYIEKMGRNADSLFDVAQTLADGDSVPLFAEGEDGIRAANQMASEFVRYAEEAENLLERFYGAE